MPVHTHVVGVDWGTSSMRGYLLRAHDGVVEDTAAVEGAGALQVAEAGLGKAGFRSALKTLVEQGGRPEWRDAATPIVMCGMVGSRLGWVEAPYVDAPSKLTELGRRLVGLPEGDGLSGRQIWIAAGMKCAGAHGGAPDVMRGEETQLLGAASGEDGDGTRRVFVLPGTHSKWAVAEGGKLVAFHTQMTGDAFAALAGHSILAQSVSAGGGSDTDAPWEPAFDAGVDRTAAPGGLLAHAFTVRTEALAGRFAPRQLKAYLSGVLLGYEVRAGAVACGGCSSELTIVGNAALNARYRRAAQRVYAGTVTVRCVDGGDAVAKGLWRLWRGVAAPTAAPLDVATVRQRYKAALALCPVVAILRGVRPHEAVAVAEALIRAGVTMIEVPLNSPDYAASIKAIAAAAPPHVLVGAGTVLTPAQVDEVVALGGCLIVSPNCDKAVIARAAALNAICLPGVSTPTEAFAALAHGATGLKAFPGEALPPKVLKAWRAVLPQEVDLFAVGGVGEATMKDYWACGVRGFGVGTSLYAPGRAAADVEQRARALVARAAALRDGGSKL